MEYTKQQEEKLTQAKELLKLLGLPSAQQNNRSGWVFLALANVPPNKAWDCATAPLLPTVAIMEFIRNDYGMDYKPNSRETIRRQTLHQFEQARIVERNRDDPSRPTNSALNNYSLNQPIIDILLEYPYGNWENKLNEFKATVPELTDIYERRLDKHKVSIVTQGGEQFKLSPGKHNELHAAIIHDFTPRFIGNSCELLYLGDTASSRNEGGKLMHLNSDYLLSLGVPPMAHDKLPDIVIYDTQRKWLFLIEAVTSHGPVSPKRWIELQQAFKDCIVGLVYVSAFPSSGLFKKFAAEIAWETEVWIADNPDHMIHFNGDRFLGPHTNIKI